MGKYHFKTPAFFVLPEKLNWNFIIACIASEFMMVPRGWLG